jgi:hypothetical protein
MNNNDGSTVLHFQRFAPASARETSAGKETRLIVSIPSPSDGCVGAFNPETTVTFVRKKAERMLNDAAFVENMS